MADKLLKISLYFSIDIPTRPGMKKEEAQEIIRGLFRDYVNSETFDVKITSYTLDAEENITAFNMEVTK